MELTTLQSFTSWSPMHPKSDKMLSCPKPSEPRKLTAKVQITVQSNNFINTFKIIHVLVKNYKSLKILANTHSLHLFKRKEKKRKFF